ncbi:hypothetical protein SEVIR_9G468801v4 [Setaria viridis]
MAPASSTPTRSSSRASPRSLSPTPPSSSSAPSAATCSTPHRSTSGYGLRAGASTTSGRPSGGPPRRRPQPHRAGVQQQAHRIRLAPLRSVVLVVGEHGGDLCGAVVRHGTRTASTAAGDADSGRNGQGHGVARARTRRAGPGGCYSADILAGGHGGRGGGRRVVAHRCAAVGAGTTNRW